ncbi:TetR/AcrR family transcriptional regulator [Mangrovibacillus cuniculi]|uniref:TetR/AcrR family transcriptional regulator n=1 Tax=Mangrovibacillus cuniculi TaxID=2593652 RepID=A0A7S8HGR5_9BACI|nr:TetR/AcrR family transcriptional regulator [Mangrovibacillus cuniculi]QPC48173.1 TetR/AcrR family transcriptional regulator [Mangrovibacillus cuniculi]
MSKQTVITEAMRLFAEKGYDGASLSMIAKAAGMKTPSLYAHVESKDDLFLTAFSEVMKKEEETMKRAMKDQRGKERLKAIFTFYTDPNGRELERAFYLRALFFPPEHLEKDIKQMVIHVETMMSHELVQTLRELELLVLEENWIHSFYALMDGLLLEQRLYEDEELQQRIVSAWATLEALLKEEK